MRALSHLGAFHSWVEDSFPEEISKPDRTRKLWRIDVINGNQHLLVVSSTKPNLELLEKYGISGSAGSKSYDKFLDSLKEGMRVRFRVTLNPTISVKTDDLNQKRGRKFPLLAVEGQLKYFEDRSNKNGFELEANNYKIVNRGFEQLKKANQRMVRLSVVTYEGILTITNIEQFRETLVSGLGGKKAYGCGLMTVIPIE
jgi:CRISPR system Cascade subunit CasE